MTIAFAASRARPRSSSVMLLRVGTLEGCWGPPPVPARGEGSRLTVGVGVAAAVVDAAVVLASALGEAVTSVTVGVRPAVVVAGAGVAGVGVLVAVDVPPVMRVPPGAELSVLAEQPVASRASTAAAAVILRVMERGFL